MDRTYWQRQTPEASLFPDLLWSRPENKRQAGKLLVVGGNSHGFAAAGEAYAAAEEAGIGTTRVLLPNSLQKTVGRIFAAGEYAPSTPSGSFSRQALAELLDLAAWGDGVLLAGDFGRNSETAVLLEQFLVKYSGQLSLAQDAVDYFAKTPATLLARQDTTLILSFAQLQQLASNARFPLPFTFNMDFLHVIDALHKFTTEYYVNIVVKHLQNIFVAINGQVSSTKLQPDLEIWRVRTAAHTAVWWLQNPAKAFEALTAAMVNP